MVEVPPHLLSLSEADRALVQTFLTEFADEWNPQRLGELFGCLPDHDKPLRRTILLELVGRDIGKQWETPARPSAESYLERYPELGTKENPPIELILAEHDARKKAEAPSGLGEFSERFPALADELRQHIAPAEQTEGISGPTPAGPLAAGDTLLNSAKQSPTVNPRMPAKLDGQSFGRYRILRTLGKGGMGSVYLARDDQLERDVALKVPHLGANDGPEVLARFYREAKAAATLNHPNICPVFDVGEFEGIPYLTMAYVEGKPLSDVIKGGKSLPERKAAKIVRQLALAVEEAHRRGVVHRDLKPSNVLMNQRDEPILMDFGVARQVNQEGERITHHGRLIGTPEYMAPEQTKGDPDTSGPPCDIYSLGTVLYKLLAGRVPYEGAMLEVLVKLATEEPKPPSAHRPDLTPMLEAICLKAMARDPANRYQSMGDFAAALEGFLKDRSTPVPEPKAEPEPVLAEMATIVGPVDTVRGTQELPPEAPNGADAKTLLDAPPAPPPMEPAEPARGRSPWGTVVALGIAAALSAGGFWFFALKPGPKLTGRVPDTKIALSTESKRGNFERASEAFKDKSYKQALELVNQAVADDPKREEAYLLRARVQAALGSHQSAIDDLTKLLQIPAWQKSEIYEQRGLAYLETKHDPEAIVDLTQAIDKSLQEADANLYAARGRARLRQKQYAPAVMDFLKAGKLDPNLRLSTDLGGAYAGMGQELLNKKEFADAVVSFTAALDHDPNNRSLHIHLGDALSGKGNLDAAQAQYIKAWQQNPKAGDLGKRLDESFCTICERFVTKNKDFSGAIDLLDKRIDAETKLPWPYYYRGKMYQLRGKNGDLDNAAADYTRALKLAPEQFPDVRKRLDEVYQRQSDIYLSYKEKDYRTAIGAYTTRIEKDPSNSWAYTQRGRFYSLRGEAGDAEKALNDFKRAVDLNTQDALAYRYSGDVHAQLKMWDEAGADFAQAVKLNPDDVRNWSQRGHWLVRQKNFKAYQELAAGALQHFRDAEDASTLNLAAWTGAMIPGAVSDATAAVTLADRAVEKAAPLTKFFYMNTLAAALYRANRVKEAEEKLERILKERGDDTRGILNDWLLLAIVKDRQGKMAEANAFREDARKQVQRFLEDPNLAWNRRVELEVLGEEAKALPKTKP